MTIRKAPNQITDRPQIKASQAPIPRQVILPPKVSPAELQQMRQNRDQAIKLAEQSRLNAQQSQQKADQMRKALPVRPEPPSNTGNIGGIPKTPPPPVKPVPRVITDPMQQNQQSFMDPSMISGFAGVGALPSPQYDIVGNVNNPSMGGGFANVGALTPIDNLSSGMMVSDAQYRGPVNKNPLVDPVTGNTLPQLGTVDFYNAFLRQTPQTYEDYVNSPTQEMKMSRGQYEAQQNQLGQQRQQGGQMPWNMGQLGMPPAQQFNQQGGFAGVGATPPQTMPQTGFAPMGGFQNIGSLLGKG